MINLKFKNNNKFKISKRIKKFCHFDLPAGEEKSLIDIILGSARDSSLRLGMTKR